MPSATAINAVLARLKDAAVGYNARIAEVAAERSVDGSPWLIDFDTPGGNFFKAHVAPQAWLGSTEQRYPTMFLFAESVFDQQRMRGGMFSGRVAVGIDMILGAWESRPPPLFEDSKALVTDAMIRVFSDNVAAQLDSGVNYVGDISA